MDPRTPLTPALVYTRSDFALALKCGLRRFDRLRATDPTFPAPILVVGLAGRPKWRKTEVEAWLVARAQRQPGMGAT
jgi:hypothetical protein